jgi:membrane protein CcdC involved in cytochrome C biogenesis
MNGSAVYGIMILVVGLVFWRRTMSMIRPIKGSGIRILLPIIYVTPVLSLFAQLPIHLKLWEIGIASLTGLLLAIPLMLTTNYEIREDGHIYAQKNKSFFIALIAVVAIRIVLRQYFSSMDAASLSMLFFTVAVSYVVPWRLVSFMKFRSIKQMQEQGSVVAN